MFQLAEVTLRFASNTLVSARIANYRLILFRPLAGPMPKLSVATRERLRRLQPPKALWRLFGLSMIQSINGLMSTLNYRMFRYDPAADPADEQFASPVIFVFWHEYIFFPIHLRPHCRLAMLLSQHQDAEILSHVAGFAGLETVRGSSSRGGTTALKELIARGQGMSLAITPDGPRGPRRHLAQGCVYLSSRLQIPIVPIGFGCDRPWRNRHSWDKFAIPRPGSRARAVVGPRIQVPPQLDRIELEAHRQWIGQQLNAITTIAEDWAESRGRPSESELLVRSPPRAPVLERHPALPETGGRPAGVGSSAPLSCAAPLRALPAMVPPHE